MRLKKEIREKLEKILEESECLGKVELYITTTPIYGFGSGVPEIVITEAEAVIRIPIKESDLELDR
jgi:hypothetical protein